MVLEIVIYLVVIIAIALSLSLFLEALTDLLKTTGESGKRNIIVSLAAICCSYYFFSECMGYFKGRVINYDYWVFLVAGLVALGVITIARETVKDRNHDRSGEIDDTSGEDIVKGQETRQKTETEPPHILDIED